MSKPHTHICTTIFKDGKFVLPVIPVNYLDDRYDMMFKANQELQWVPEDISEEYIPAIREAIGQLSILRCAYTKNQVGYIETTGVINRLKILIGE